MVRLVTLIFFDLNLKNLTLDINLASSISGTQSGFPPFSLLILSIVSDGLIDEYFHAVGQVVRSDDKDTSFSVGERYTAVMKGEKVFDG